mgnify:CR=1 FL=1
MKKKQLTNILTILGVVILSIYFWGFGFIEKAQSLIVAPQSNLETIYRQLETISNWLNAVSYTHLTLPTIYSV